MLGLEKHMRRSVWERRGQAGPVWDVLSFRDLDVLLEISHGRQWEVPAWS